ncbi:MAG: FecR family protein [Gammaproteobacteria bacterium]
MNTTQAEKTNLSTHFLGVLCSSLVLFVACSLSMQSAYAAKHAAKVIYSFGDVKAQGEKGARGLKKGDLVFSGESVATTRGRAQIKFTDGGFASLQPNTEYKIDDYTFEGKADGKERSFLSLLKGSVRLVTGVIGKANRRNFRIKTAVATIGIRGTQGTLTHDPVTNVTSLRGHGGEWDLESGSFSGGVPAGQAYSCDGVSCAQVAGVRQRSDVGRGRGRAQRRQQAYEQGQQTDPDGRICDLGGACDELAVTVDQVGAVAFTEDDVGLSGGTEFLEQLGVVTVGDEPVALVSDQTIDGELGGGFVATDIEAIRTAINTFTEEDDADFVTEANAFLDELDSELLAELEANPASVAVEDFATTPDGLVTLGRWVEGNILFAVKGFGTGDVLQRLDTLENFESVHFAYGNALENITFGGIGYYSLTGATYPTAVDGSSMGQMPLAGSLSWDFGTATGALAIPLMFDGIQFTLGGTLQAPDAQDLSDPSVSRIFTDTSVSAIFFMGGIPMTASASVDGFFTGENGTNAPLAAGLTYAVNYYMNPFVGAAAFGLAGQEAFVPNATIKYAVNYFDSGSSVGSYSNGDDMFPMGTPLSNFSTGFGDTFNAASNIESGIDASTQVHWARFANPYTFSSPFLVSGAMFSEDFHAIRADYTTPDSVIASTTGTQTFTLAGGTSPTMVYDQGNSFFQEVGTLTTATFSANFTTGTMTSISIAGVFPAVASGVFTAGSVAATPINSGFAAMGGTFTDGGTTGSAGCGSSPCTLTGALNYGFTSASAGGPPVGIISSFNFSGTGSSFGSSPFGISGTAFSN